MVIDGEIPDNSLSEDAEVPEADALEQTTSVDRAGSESPAAGLEVPEADAFEQSQPVPDQQEDEPR